MLRRPFARILDCPARAVRKILGPSQGLPPFEQPVCKKKGPLSSGEQGASKRRPGLRAGDDDPQQQVNEYSGDTTWDQGDQESQPKPERTDAEKLCQATTDTGNNAVAP